MSLKNTTTTWGWPARTLHWLMAFMILGLLGVGTYMTSLDFFNPDRFTLTQTHKSVGFTVFILAILRVVWRLANRRSPQLPAEMPTWQVKASHYSHYALYALLFIMPLSGWLMVTSSPLNDPGAYPTQIKNMVFGLFAMPDPFATGSETITNAFHTIHALSGKLMIAILAVHTAAALKHHFVDKDTILSRMIRG